MPDYLRMRDKYDQVEREYQGFPGLKFQAGFYAGQAEKVMAGACKFCMFRPSDSGEDEFSGVINDIADTYGLTVHRLPNAPEYWLCLKENEDDFFDLLEMEPDSPAWHRQRGRMCGIAEIDEAYHLRTRGVHS